jgi:hypothetical protein
VTHTTLVKHCHDKERTPRIAGLPTLLFHQDKQRLVIKALIVAAFLLHTYE